MQTIRLGTQNRDTLIGTSHNDWFQPGDGDDVMFGNGGNDRFDAGAGNDRMHGGNGADTMLGGAGDDTVYAGGGNDWVEGGEGRDKIYADAGNDTVDGGAGDDLIEAGSGNDLVFGGSGSDEIQGEAGNDTIQGGRDNGRMSFATETTCLDKAIDFPGGDFKGGSTLDFDLKSVNGVGGTIRIVLDGVTHNVATGAINAKVGGADWTTFCSQLPESISFGVTKGFVMRGADEAFAVSDDIAHGKSIPTPETVLRDLALERAQTLLVQDMFNDIGLKGCDVRGFVHAGKQDQIGVEGLAKLSAAQGSAMQLLMWEIAYDFNGKLDSLNLGGGDFTTDLKTLNKDVLKAFETMRANLSLDGLVSPVKNAANPLSITIGDNLYGNDGRDTYIFERGDGVDLIWDFETGADIIHIKGYKSTDVDAFTFVTTVENVIATGAHQKLAIILDTSGDAIVFNDLGNRNAGGAAVKFDDKTMTMQELLAKASAPAIAGSSPAPAGDEVNAAIAIKNSWWGGFQGEITVTAKSALTDWDVLLGTKFNVNSVWGADLGSSTVTVGGKLIDLNDANWNGTLAAGQTATIGFTAETGFAGVMSNQQIMDGLWIG